MLQLELFQIFAGKLNHLGIRYMITGSCCKKNGVRS